ncbi:hypothetical protein SPRG_04493 [Saprolegnia parasitica CBS 223.65]|uniref:UBX domain-containing protein n=1 Tax=Saprolegnia parasitica (strain CBS 223.65) TaxID=695850 RepID=A0A067CJ96_SAPPC|nr:hypothetical protein SPRG_04493 [Saprolegnia parasitica CBS 223.65]KDO30593.1 hypothetical protein SPRG_04493 [Saprolegnia parasitica CBS 223.65]|eukprot:XP_012198807.1 hypothetical protein SPRG_04493 [Saprolegnia parasitica CBS 223.65]
MNVFGFGNLRNRAANDDSDSDEEKQSYYTGGTNSTGGGSGLSVYGNPTGGPPSIDNIISRAQQQGAQGDASATPSHVITFYADGFTVDDGEYRRRDDENNREFLTAIERGVVPRELEALHSRGQHVDISLVDKRTEQYKESAKPKYAAFAGEGQSMGATKVEAAAIVSDAPTALAPVDTTKPTTVIQIRLANGGRVRETFNTTHTVRDIHAVLHREGATGQAYVLMAGFPPKPLVGMDETLQEAGLLGAAITQKWA